MSKAWGTVAIADFTDNGFVDVLDSFPADSKEEALAGIMRNIIQKTMEYPEDGVYINTSYSEYENPCVYMIQKETAEHSQFTTVYSIHRNTADEDKLYTLDEFISTDTQDQ